MTADAPDGLPERVLDIVRAALFLDAARAAELTPATPFEDLDLDSLTMIRIEMLIETRLGLSLAGDDLAGVVTVGDLVGAIRTKGRPIQPA